MPGKRKTFTGEPAVPYYCQPGNIEMAKFLSLTARRYANGNANKDDVKKAYAMWLEEVEPVTKSTSK